ncbi:MAG: putative flippase GtrA [Verrucomicrobiales bacterium]|jgi:putative flippase GtrA
MIHWKSLQERDTRPFAQIIRYGIVGLSATLLHVSIFSIFSLWINPAIDPELGNEVRAHRSTINTTIAFLISNVYTYLINSRYVFVPGRHSRMVEFGLFLAVSALSFGLGVWINRFLIATHGVPTFPAQGAFIVTSALINYVCRRFIVFKT